MVTEGVQTIEILIPPEKIKKSHINGKYDLISFSVGNIKAKTNYSSSKYDFRDFSSDYLDYFSDEGIDTNSNGKFDVLRIPILVKMSKEAEYSVIVHLYDQFGASIGTKNVTSYLEKDGVINVDFDGSVVFDKKLDGPYVTRYAALYRNYVLVDELNDAFVTNYYNFDAFDPTLSDLEITANPSKDYHYGSNNITLNVTITNKGKKNAFNVFFEVFVNNSRIKSNSTAVIKSKGEHNFTIYLDGISDTRIDSIVDSRNLVDESNEEDNLHSTIIKINKKPRLYSLKNITVNETDTVFVNLDATDENGDELVFSSNLSKIKSSGNGLFWKTTTVDSGHYILNIIASDGYLEDNSIFEINVLDSPEKDSDNDGINESVDRVYGSIKSRTFNFSLLIGGSKNLSRIFDSVEKVELQDSNITVMEFHFDFSRNLSLQDITIEKQDSNHTGSMFISGFPNGIKKTVYVDKLSSNRGICIKDSEIDSMEQISNFCNFVDEFLVECDGLLQYSYSCSYIPSYNKYKVTGLSHSGIIQFEYEKPVKTNTESLSASGSASGSCQSRWNCTKWSSCSFGSKKRECIDVNRCEIKTGIPDQKMECTQSPSGSKILDLLGFKESDDKTKETTNENSITGNVIDSKHPGGFNLFDSIIILSVLCFVAFFAWNLLHYEKKHKGE